MDMGRIQELLVGIVCCIVSATVSSESREERAVLTAFAQIPNLGDQWSFNTASGYCPVGGACEVLIFGTAQKRNGYCASRYLQLYDSSFQDEVVEPRPSWWLRKASHFAFYTTLGDCDERANYVFLLPTDYPISYGEELYRELLRSEQFLHLRDDYLDENCTKHIKVGAVIGQTQYLDSITPPNLRGSETVQRVEILNCAYRYLDFLFVVDDSSTFSIHSALERPSKVK